LGTAFVGFIPRVPSAPNWINIFSCLCVVIQWSDDVLAGDCTAEVFLARPTC